MWDEKWIFIICVCKPQCTCSVILGFFFMQISFVLTWCFESDPSNLSLSCSCSEVSIWIVVETGHQSLSSSVEVDTVIRCPILTVTFFAAYAGFEPTSTTAWDLCDTVSLVRLHNLDLSKSHLLMFLLRWNTKMLFVMPLLNTNSCTISFKLP